MESHAPVLIVLPLLLGSFIVPGLGLWRRGLSFPSALAFLLAFLGFAVAGLMQVMRDGALRYELGGWVPPIGIELNLDMLAAFVLVVIAFISVVVAIYASTAVSRELPGKEAPFFGLMLMMLLGLAGMVVTGDLFNLYVFFEVSSLSGYALMALGHRKAAVSAYRYLLMGTMGASLYLLGVGYIYILTGSLNMVDVAPRLAELGGNPALLVSVVLMVAGLGLKMALFPMHLWLPDAYTYASSTATAIIAPVMTKVSAYVMIRMLFFIYDAQLIRADLPVTNIIAWLATAGVVVGSVMAIAQRNVKRMLAYSSVAQVAYIGVGIGLANPLALVGAMLHILNHAVMKCCLFLVTGSVQLQTGRRHVASYAGLGRAMPWTFAGFTLAALAMVGIPPTSGFFSKWYLVLGGIQEGEWALVALLLASGLLTAVYFFRMLETVYTKGAVLDPRDAKVEGVAEIVPKEAGATMRLPVVALGVGVLVLGLLNAWFVRNVLSEALPSGWNMAGF